METSSKKYFPNLDALRFVLAFIVLSSHAMLGTTLNQVVSNDLLKRIVSVFTAGNLAVSFFFVLSGFLITYLMIEEKESTGNFSIKNFYVRRIFRIWPLYYCILLFGFGVYPFIKTHLGYSDQNPYSLLQQSLFLGNFDNIKVHEDGLVGVAPMMIGITWSVSIEEQFYLVWPLLFSLVQPKKFWVICLLVVVGSITIRLATGLNPYYHTLSVVSDMAIGGLGACFAFYSEKFVNFFSLSPKYLIFLIYVLGFSMLFYSGDIFTNFFIAKNQRVLNALFFCFIIIEQSFASNSLFKLSNLKMISSWGKYTYGLYMVHPIGIQLSIILFRYAGIENDNFWMGILYFLIATIASMIFSMLSFRFVESYFLKKRQLFY